MSRKRAHHKGWARSAVLLVICTACISILASSVSALDWKATQKANQSQMNIATTTVNSDTPWGHDNKPQSPERSDGGWILRARLALRFFVFGVHSRHFVPNVDVNMEESTNVADPHSSGTTVGTGL